MDLMSGAAEEENTASEGNPEQELVDDLHKLDFMLDVPLNVGVELGRTEISLRELLQIGQGSVLELEKLAGEPLEVLVNERLVSKGEVVVVNEKYGIRLTDIIDPLDSGNETKPSR
ncbi:MAG: flagellar motor switch protein FliN [Bacteriovoracaceae bacterium]